MGDTPKLRSAMPYIQPEERTEIDKMLKGLRLETHGQVAYAITRLVLESGLEYGSYAGLAALNGMLDLVKVEFQNRLVEPYEAYKRKVNGDAF